MYRSTLVLTAFLILSNVAAAGQIMTTKLDKKITNTIQRHGHTSNQGTYGSGHHQSNGSTYGQANGHNQQQHNNHGGYAHNGYNQHQNNHGGYGNHGHFQPIHPQVIAMRRQWMQTLRNINQSLNHCHCFQAAANQLRNLIHCVRTSRPSNFNRQLVRRLQFVTMELQGYDINVYGVQEQLRSIIWDIKSSLR